MRSYATQPEHKTNDSRTHKALQEPASLEEIEVVKPRIVLIDDDPNYRTIMCRLAEQEGIQMEAFESLADLGSVGRLSAYDVALVDYDLGDMNGVEIGEYLSAMFHAKPMVLVSHTIRKQSERVWPNSIKAFALKSDGYRSVLRKALTFTKRDTLVPISLHFGENSGLA